MPHVTDITAAPESIPTAERRAQVDCRSLTDAELVAALTGLSLRSAKELMRDTQCLRGLSQTVLEPTAELKLSAAFELARRLEHEIDPRPVFDTPNAIAFFMQRKLKRLPHEELWVLCLNSRNVLLKAVRASKGSIASCAVDPRDVFAPALLCKSTGIVVAHNHPSGDPTPSFADHQLTKQLARAGDALCIKLLDHVIVAEHVWNSMKARGDF